MTYGTNYEFIGWEPLLHEWLPKVLGAVLILVAAWFIGKAIKWALAKGVDRIPGASRANLSDDPRRTVGRSLGEVAFWLILLFGVVAALGVLNLAQVVTPLNTLLNQVAGFVPNILGAALIFFIGFVVATLARRVTEAAMQAANADHWLDRAGVTRATGSTGLSTAAGTLVFILLLIPITIAALEQLGIQSITLPAVAVLSMVFEAIPRVLAAALVLAVGWLIGRWVAQVVERILPATGFDRSVDGVARLFRRDPDPSATGAAPYAGDVTPATAAALGGDPVPALTPSRMVGRLVMVAIVAFTAVEAARLLQFNTLAATVEEILELAGRVIVGAVIITAGVLIADVLSRLIDKGTAGADRFASTIIRWATIALAVAMGLRFMGIADDIVLLAFGLTLGAASVAAALAFGLGGRGPAADVAQTWADRITGRRPRG
jgi:Conserved TM helix